MGSLGGPSMGHMGNWITSACGSRSIAPLRGFMNRHCKDPGCSFQTLEGRSLIGNYIT